jgi:ferritin-like protein
MASIVQFVQQGINSSDELKEALQLAVQLEFATLPPYLCAEWSVNSGNDPDNVAGTINGIAQQEMFHFALAGNILTAIGGVPDIARAGFVPQYPTNVLPGGIAQKLPVDLKPLSYEQLDVFLQIEYPQFPPVALALAQGPATIGAFYDTISQALNSINPAIVPNAPQVNLGEAVPITSVADAQNAISLIKGEGEGTEGSPDEPPPDSTVLAHYYAFKEIRTGHRLVKESGKWSFSGAPVRFPSVFDFKPAPNGSSASADFNQTLSQLLTELQTCWTSGVSPDIGKMFDLQAKGTALIQQGIRPEFLWSSSV